MTRTRRGRFQTTRWSLVVAAGDDHSSVAHLALATLCELYWYPLYAYVRRHGHDAEDAQDLTQSFFAGLLERRDIRGLQRERGRLRSYFLAALRHFLLNQAVHRQALKRGGAQPTLSLEFQTAEDRYIHEPADAATPETIYERRWALTVLDQVFRDLRHDWELAGKETEFDRLKTFLAGDLPSGGYQVLAAELESNVNATTVMVHRLRREFRRRLREVIADTVTSEDAVDDELKYLFTALRR